MSTNHLEHVDEGRHIREKVSQEAICLEQDFEKLLRKQADKELVRIVERGDQGRRLSWDANTKLMFKKATRNIYKHASDGSYWKLQTMEDGQEFIVAVNDIPQEPVESAVSVEETLGPWSVKSSVDGEHLILRYGSEEIKAFNLKQWNFDDPALAAKAIISSCQDPDFLRVFFKEGLSADKAARLYEVYEGPKTLTAILQRVAQPPAEEGVDPEAVAPERPMEKEVQQAKERLFELHNIHKTINSRLDEMRKELYEQYKVSEMESERNAAEEILKREIPNNARNQVQIQNLLFRLEEYIPKANFSAPTFRRKAEEQWGILQKDVKALMDESKTEPKAVERLVTEEKEAGLLDTVKNWVSTAWDWIRGVGDAQDRLISDLEAMVTLFETEGGV